MNEWTIYCHTHIASGRRYIGQSSRRWTNRWREHCYNATHGRRRSFFLNALQKHGPDAFGHEVLETCATQDEANAAEARWIEHFKTMDPEFGFNRLKGGRGEVPTRRNPWESPEFRAKMLATTIPKALAGLHSPEARAKAKATKQTPEHKARASAIGKEVGARPGVKAARSLAMSRPELRAVLSENAKRLPHIVAQSEQTHCKRGHEFSPENTGHNTKGSRICRLCKNERQRGYYGPLKPRAAHCLNGHEFTPENTWVRPGTTNRCCRACNRERQRVRNQRPKDN